VQVEGGVLRFIAVRDRVFATTGHIFLIWLLLATALLLTVAILFIRNQVKPIRQLAEAAEAFGRGQDVERFKPAGAREVRRAALAFLDMRARLKRHIEQRTQLLAGVSHDLRTPLTRCACSSP
jgi:two-component system osmolarity sensor histidine kinase EnvZ